MSRVTSAKPDRKTRHLWWALVVSELRVFLRQPVMIALSLLVPAGLLAITAIGERTNIPEVWASIAGRNTAAVLCISVYFVSLNTITARRHTLALKRLRTTALPDTGIVTGLLVPPIVVGLFQFAVSQGGLVALGAPLPGDPLLVLTAGVSGILVAALAGVVTSAVTANPEKAQWTMLPLFVATLGAASVLPTVTDPAVNLALRAVPLVANADWTTAAWLAEGDVARLAADAGIVVIWLVVLSLLSRRTFRWERRR
ncbi:hypothetical protein GCM10022261_00440 [Brevibacterium daeguense]|uniref:ABC-2 type transport system permease protein n=1 Tax=Brevibacterium daeguense TaxID=909936 RepID=A0ABP8EEU6_9MICO|nr:hypothetical protein [Brevibacterium daeguense]